jgi:hypothetical protein
MGNDEIVNYKLLALEKRMDAYEVKTDLILSKLDSMKEANLKQSCPAPGTCVTLRIVVEGLVKAQDKIVSRLDEMQEHVNKIDLERIETLEDDISTLQAWRNWLIGLAVPVVAVLGFFTDEIKSWLFK